MHFHYNTTKVKKGEKEIKPVPDTFQNSVNFPWKGIKKLISNLNNICQRQNTPGINLNQKNIKQFKNKMLKAVPSLVVSDKLNKVFSFYFSLIGNEFLISLNLEVMKRKGEIISSRRAELFSSTVEVFYRTS